MPLRSDWRPQREGIRADTLGRLISNTLLNPILTLPLLLLARYTQKGQQYAALNEHRVKQLKTLLYLGLLQKTSHFLDRAVANNWSNDVYDWKKEIVVVTGGSDGIGAIVARLLAERGTKVVVLDIQPLTYEAPDAIRYYHCDLNSTASISNAADAIKKDIGDPTILINNAGFTRGKTILDSTEPDIRLTFNINTLSHYFLTQAFLPHMISTNHGMVVTVASTAGYITAPRMTDYAASKTAAIAFHEGLAAELAAVYNAPKVRTVLMCQGYTSTKMFQGFDTGDGFVTYGLEPETVAEAIVKAVWSGRSTQIVLPATGWWTSVSMRGWPLWMQIGMRKGLAGLMKGYKGRQVEQPWEGRKEDKEQGEKQESERLEESVVEVQAGEGEGGN